MFILKTGHQPGVYVPLRALFLVENVLPAMMKRIKFNCSFISDLLLTIRHNV